jgi:hypothetical protein
VTEIHQVNLEETAGIRKNDSYDETVVKNGFITFTYLKQKMAILKHNVKLHDLLGYHVPRQVVLLKKSKNLENVKSSGC